VDALIASPLGKLRIIGTHLSLSPWGRWSELRNLVSLVDAVEEKEKNPFLLMGDINEWHVRSRLLRHLDKLMKPLPCGPSFPSFRPILRLDRIWYDHCPFPVRAQILDCKDMRHLSDHLPLLISLGDPAVTP
jgi:endonuclease/exonuclease/phosphatase family metal-dependent hydrolase